MLSHREQLTLPAHKRVAAQPPRSILAGLFVLIGSPACEGGGLFDAAMYAKWARILAGVFRWMVSCHHVFMFVACVARYLSLSLPAYLSAC